jgi:hypothetical protein
MVAEKMELTQLGRDVDTVTKTSPNSEYNVFLLIVYYGFDLDVVMQRPLPQNTSGINC